MCQKYSLKQVILKVIVYFGERIQIKISQGKKYIRLSRKLIKIRLRLSQSLRLEEPTTELSLSSPYRVRCITFPASIWQYAWSVVQRF